MSTVKISAVILTFNEERNIGRCIDSLVSVADEILVVDSYSTDNTQQIAEEKGVKFIQNAFTGYIEQKNFAMQHAAFDHILSLDADEALDEELSTEVMRIKNDFDKDGYWVNRLTNYCGHWIRHCGWHPDWKIRLFNRNKGHWTGINPHDRFELNPGSTDARLGGMLLHYSFYTEEEHWRQIERFSTIAAHGMFDAGFRSDYAKLMYKPLAKFVKSYILKMGFLDGLAGWKVCTRSAQSSYLKYYKLMQRQNEA